MHTNNYTTAYIYYATGHDEDEDGCPLPEPCLFDYVCDVEETPLDCDSLDLLLAEWVIEDETGIAAYR